MDEYKVYRLGGVTGEELCNLIAVFYDLSNAEEYIKAEHSGFSDYALVHNDKIICDTVWGCRV